jgi:error-prone DNA polymerase
MMPTTPTTPSLPAYAELQCASNFSFLRGASHPEQLVARAAALGYSALAITDECSLAGVVRAHVEAKRHQLSLIIGSQFRVHTEEGNCLTLIALVMNREGYGNLCELITLARSRAEKGDYRLTLTDFTDPEDQYRHLRTLPNCLLLLAPDYGISAAQLHRQAKWLKSTFGARAYLALSLLYRGRDEQHKLIVMQTSAMHSLDVVATGDVCMHIRSRKPLQDVLAAIRLGKPVAQCGQTLFSNAEQHLRSRLRLANIYPHETLHATTLLAAQCQFSLDTLRYEYPDELVPRGQTPTSYLREQTWAGAHRRFPSGIPANVQEQIEHELALIAELAYEPYFLTVYDIVSFARHRHILCQGRGSAANSAVCYCLGITEVDPARSSLLFERFISKERNEPPDIDVDFEHQRREEVIQYIYEKYGRQRAALTGVVISYRGRSALRDAGQGLGCGSIYRRSADKILSPMG